MRYDYALLTLARAPTPHQALAAYLSESVTGLVGQFAPQLGWANNEAAVLLRVAPEAEPGELTVPNLITQVRRERLTPTLRPADESLPRPGGVYVHRWFEVDAGAADEFVELSGRGWERFEAKFDTQIFGLFRAEISSPDAAAGIERLLLLTRYADHAVWEASRDPTSEAMRIFARRQQLTRRSWAASTLLVPAR